MTTQAKAKIEKKAQDVLGQETTKSSKIRQLAGMNYTRSQIAKMMNIRYQHVRNVLIQPLKKEQG